MDRDSCTVKTPFADWKEVLENLQDLALFVAIARASSLSEVARQTGRSLAAVSKQLSRLEHELGVLLVRRSTRHLYLTPEGSEYALHCQRILEAMEEARSAIQPEDAELSGEIRITASLPFSRRHLAPLLAAFGQRHPRVQLKLTSTDAMVNMLSGEFDLAFRQAEQIDGALVARVLAPDARIPCAAPSYIAQHGVPRTPEDLVGHRCLLPGNPPITSWRFVEHATGAQQRVEVGTSAFQTNDGEVAHAATLAGAGIALKSAWDVAEDLETGRLVNVLPGFSSPAGFVHAVYLPGPRPLAGKQRQLIDFIAEHLAASPVLRWIDAPPAPALRSPAMIHA
jgi:DNA-binding transcriptional LysR family regulator